MKKTLFLFIAVWACSLSWAIPVNFRFKHFSVEDGLFSNSVRALLQDRRGLIWFGTDEGLNYYDGVNIHGCFCDGKKLGGWKNDFVCSLFEDEESRLWIGTETGLFIYSYNDNSFTPFAAQTRSGIRITTQIGNVTQDKDLNIWISTYGQGVFKYHTKTQELEQYEFIAHDGIVPCVYADTDNSIWAVASQGDVPLYKLNKAANRFEPSSMRYLPGESSSRALVVLEDSSHFLWLGTWDCGLQRVDRYSGEVTTYLHPSSPKGIMHIHSLMEYEPGKLMIGSDDGLSLFTVATGEHLLFNNEETNPYSLSNKFVYPVVKDREGGIWIGTFYGGVNYISPHSDQFEGYVQSRFTNSVNGNIIGRFCEDKRGDVWIASDDGGLNRYTPTTGCFVNYMPSTKNSISYHNVHALCMDDDNLWIGTYSGGLNVLNTKTGVFKKYISYHNDSTTIDDNSIYAILKDRDNQIWVTSMSGVNRYNAATDNFSRVKELGILTIDIKQDTKGTIWFATQGKGLFKYDPKKDIWKNYISSDKPGALPSNQINSICIDTKGQLWIGTTSGLCQYNMERDSFERIPLVIPSNSINCIIEDQQILWLTTSKGLVRYTPGEGCQVFTKSDGLQSDHFLANSGIKTSDGKIYIGSVNGFNTFYPYRIRSNTFVPPVILTSLEIFNKEIMVGDPAGCLPRALSQLDQLTLSYKENVFSIRYAALSYCTPEKNQYAYKLEGFDKEWNYVGNQSKATYTNLPAGTYLFRVKGSNSDGVWNEEGTRLKIVIYPPFYKTMAFQILYFILIGVAFVFFIRYILWRTKKRHVAEINKLNASKEKEVHKAKIQFFTMIAHEIRTPVSLIIGPLEKIMQSALQLPEVLRNDLTIIDRNSQRLLFLVNQLLDFRKVEQEGTLISCSAHNIHQLLAAVCERFKPWITQRGASLIVQYPDADFIATVDREAITKVVSNLLTNASKYTQDEVLLSCSVQAEQHTFTIRVTDNGEGISEHEQAKIFKPFYQSMSNKPGTGLGLSIAQSIVEAHGGCIEVSSIPGQGATFSVTLPIDQPQSGEATDQEGVINPSIPEDILSETLQPISSKNKPVMLIADDNEEMIGFLSGNFCDRYVILAAADGRKALKLLQSNDVTLIISDWMMPEMDGVEFCKAVRANQLTSHIPFILLTAKTDVASKVESMDCGADAHIEKPFSVQYLEACIKNLIDLRSLLRQKFSRMPLVPLHSIAGNSADEQFLTRMNDIIEHNFSNSDLSVDFLAEKLCISRSGLFAKIKTLANVTPNELIQLIRLKKAAALLLENKYRVNEVSYMVGFNNPSYFSKCFQKQFGVKPGEFTGGSRVCIDG